MLPGKCFEPMELVDILDLNLPFLPNLVFGSDRFYAWFQVITKLLYLLNQGETFTKVKLPLLQLLINVLFVFLPRLCFPSYK